MRYARQIALVVWIGLLAALAKTASAEVIKVQPEEWDFGDVMVGDTEFKTFNLISDDEFTPIEVGAVGITDVLGSSFSIIRIDPYPIPAELYSVDPPVVVEVAFTPLVAGVHRATLWIESNDTHNYPPAGTVEVGLRGSTGFVPEPQSLVIWGAGIGLFGLWRPQRTVA